MGPCSYFPIQITEKYSIVLCWGPWGGGGGLGGREVEEPSILRLAKESIAGQQRGQCGAHLMQDDGASEVAEGRRDSPASPPGAVGEGDLAGLHL